MHFSRPSTAKTMYSENLAEAIKAEGLPMIEHGATLDQMQLAGFWVDPKSTQVYMEWSESLRVEAAKRSASESVLPIFRAAKGNRQTQLAFKSVEFVYWGMR